MYFRVQGRFYGKQGRSDVSLMAHRAGLLVHKTVFNICISVDTMLDTTSVQGPLG